jgi:hypothetical protein
MNVSGNILFMSRCRQETQFHMHKMGISCPHELINAEKAITSANAEPKQE